MQSVAETTAFVLGPETMANLRLSETLRKLLGSQRVVRHLEIPHLLAYLGDRVETPAVVFVDLFGFDLSSITSAIGDARVSRPRVVFALYVDVGIWRTRQADLPGEWANRLAHYYMLHHTSDDDELELNVRFSFRQTSVEAEYNFGHEPIRITERFSVGVLPSTSAVATPAGSGGTIFVSYSRSDWHDKVAVITEHLRQSGFQLWVDQAFLVGGDDWMDALGEAMKRCAICLLCMSPDAIQSKYVKMEYRFFFNNDKPIVPVMVRPLADIPPELSSAQFLDFSGEGALPYDALRHAIVRRITM